MHRSISIFWNSLLLSLQELKNNKIRTFLSLLGVTIGIFCVVSVFTLTKSLENNIKNEMSSIGSDIIFIQRWPWSGATGEWWRYARRPESDYNEFKQLKNRVKGAEALCYIYGVSNKTVLFGDDYMEGAQMLGMTPEFNQIQEIHIEAGRFFTPVENTSNEMTMVLGANIWKGLFKTAAASIQKKVTIDGIPFTVIGAVSVYGNNLIGGFDYDNSILLPYHVALKLANDKNTDPFIMVKPREGVSTPALSEELRGILRAIRQLKPQEEDNFSLNEMSMMTGTTQKVFGSLNMGGLMIGIFALIVGAFGIANIMFVSVKERTRFIGIKKALGARRSVILQEFLLEAIILCLVGGILGLILVFATTKAISSSVFFKITMTPEIIIWGIIISIVTGLIAGLIPAFSASKLDPVVAIRS